MNVDNLNKLPLEELRIIKNKNLSLFLFLCISDLSVFYHSMYAERWVLLFAALGVFIASLSLYDNYKISKDLIFEMESSGS